ncbi:MAG: hypothetical protein AAB209_13755 [Bacteroidota bacterium]
MSEDLMLDVGAANELKMAFRRAGWSSADVKRLGEGDWATKILPILRGNAIIQIIKHLINLVGDCMPEQWKKDKWAIEKHVGDGTLELDSSRLRLHFSPNQIDGKTIVGNQLRKEFETDKVSVLNACVLDYLLAHPDLIPEDWKKDENGNTRYIYFWGTVFRSPHGDLCVRYLCWNGGAWGWRCSFLGDDWRGRCPAAVLASVI